MPTIKDYLRWRGDLSFDERPFNDVDNVVLSALAYVDFSGIVPGEDGGGIRLSLACQRLLADNTRGITPYVRSLARIDDAFVELIADSRRFGSAILHDYVDVIDEGRSLQFAAVQVDLGERETYVAFRGTDSSIVGWRENFMLSFEVTEAQREAAAYLERAIDRAVVRGRTVRAGGHSKGGNLAEYAATCCPEELLTHVVRIYSNHGPGMAPGVMRHGWREALGNRLRLIVPSYSVIGMLFAREGDRRIVVASSGAGIGQHDLTTWQVGPTGLLEVLGLQPDCMVVNRAIASWGADLSLAEREEMTDEIFDALSAGGATHLEEITRSKEGFQQVLRALRGLDERTRVVALTLVERTVDGSIDAVRRATEEAFGQWRDSLRDRANEAMRRLTGRS